MIPDPNININTFFNETIESGVFSDESGVFSGELGVFSGESGVFPDESGVFSVLFFL